MLKFSYFTVLWKILAHFEFYGNSTSEKTFLKQHLLHIAFREGLLVYQCLPEDTDKYILCLLKQNGFIVEETGNWTSLPAVQIFH